VLDALVDSVERREGPMRLRNQTMPRGAAITRKPVELAAGVDVLPPSELDSVEISRSRSVVASGDDGASRASAPDPDSTYEDGLIPLDSEETRLLDKFWDEEKIVVDHIVNAASNWLLQNGIQPSDKIVRRGSLYRTRELPVSQRGRVSPEIPALTEKIAMTLEDLPADNNLYTFQDLLAPGFRPGEKACTAFRLEASQSFGEPYWPKSTKEWLKLAAWWLTKSRLLTKELGHATYQCYIGLSKAAWILFEVLPSDGAIEFGNKFVYNELWRLLKEAIHALRKDDFVPSALANESFRILEPTQPEERNLWLQPEKEDAVIQDLLRDESSYSFRALVAVDFGVVIPTHCAPESEKNYILTLTLHRNAHHVTVAVRNQLGHLDALNMLGEDNYPLVSETEVSTWFELEFHRRPMYVGFSSIEAAVPFWVQRNMLRRELLERPIALFSTTVEKVRYLPPAGSLISVGPAKLAFMEMRRAEDDRCRYREIKVENHFTTTRAISMTAVWRAPLTSP
jgi:hypothetical protein